MLCNKKAPVAKNYILSQKNLQWWVKGTVARDFFTSGFFYESTPYSPRIHTQKYFWILFRICRTIRFLMLFRGVWYPAGLCSAGSDTPQDFFQRGIRPRRTLFCGVSDPPQDIVLQGIRPRRTSACYKMYTTLPLFCRVWNPARLGSAGSDTLRGLIPCRVLFCGVWYPEGFCSVGYQTPLAN